MSATKHGGLSGKPRRNHNRNRALRLYSQQMVNEFFEPGTEDRSANRCIPIRGRNEFLPSVAQYTPTASGQHEQLELPLASTGNKIPAVRLGDRETVHAKDLRRQSVEKGTGVTTPKPNTVHSTKSSDNPSTRPAKNGVIRFPRSSAPDAPLPFKPPEQLNRTRRKRFTIGGFLVGCAMGSAAAAALLLVIRTVIG